MAKGRINYIASLVISVVCWNYAHVNDDKGVVAGKWNVMYIPNTYLLDKTGKVVAVNASHEQLEDLIRKLLL